MSQSLCKLLPPGWYQPDDIGCPIPDCHIEDPTISVSQLQSVIRAFFSRQNDSSESTYEVMTDCLTDANLSSAFALPILIGVEDGWEEIDEWVKDPYGSETCFESYEEMRYIDNESSNFPPIDNQLIDND